MIKIHPLHLRMANAYLVENNSGVYLVDAGMPGDERHILAKLETLGRDDLKLIYLTHAHIDHVGSAAAVKARTGALIAIHHADAQALEEGRTELGEVRGRGKLIKWCLPLIELILSMEGVKADILLYDGDWLNKYGLEAKVIHTPGHTIGSSSLLIENQHLFVGDLLSTKGKPHKQKYYACDWNQVNESLRLLRSMPAETVYPGHGRRTMDIETLKFLSESQYLIKS